MTGEVELTGRIQAITLPAVGAHPRYRVQVDSDRGSVELVFVGYRSLPGFRVGREVTARARIVPGVHPMMYNPIYWLKAETA